MTTEESNLRLLPVARESDEMLETREPANRYCRHRKGEIDETARRLFCRECGDELDPLDWLLRMSKERERWKADGEAAMAKARLADRQLEEVERKLRNAKSRLRRKGVLLSTAEARTAREQLLALGRALPNVLQKAGESMPVEKAEALAELCGYRKDEAREALTALDLALEEAGVERSRW